MTVKALIFHSNHMDIDGLSKVFNGREISVEWAESNVDGLFRLLESPVDLLLLDEDAPGLGGQEMITVLRRLSTLPIMVIGHSDEAKHIEMLDKGADVYLNLPVLESVFHAKVEMLLWRCWQSNAREEQQPARSLVTGLPLTGVERRLVACLLAHYGKTVTFKELLDEVWDGDVGYETLKYHMRRLRLRLGRLYTNLHLINVRGVGHRIVIGNDDPWTERP